jgi:hypothetical protein
MRIIKLSALTILLVSQISCKKTNSTTEQLIPIPNGNFELWTTAPTLNTWKTNSCPMCMPQINTYIVEKDNEFQNGQFAAKFIFNNVYKSWAENKFQISEHPNLLRGYIKSNITSGDTAQIHIELFSGNTIVDSGNLFETTTNNLYRQIEIPISQNVTNIDSASIKISGGKMQNTTLLIDNIVFVKTAN